MSLRGAPNLIKERRSNLGIWGLLRFARNDILFIAVVINYIFILIFPQEKSPNFSQNAKSCQKSACVIQ